VECIVQRNGWIWAALWRCADGIDSRLRVIYFNEAGEGGHFAAWEEPQLFAEGARAGFRPLR
jgi:hypothetical protein